MSTPATTARPASPATPALYDVTVTHARRERVRHSFRHRTYMWLVDLDAIPVLPRPWHLLASFRSRDHCGDPALSIRRNVDDWLAVHGYDRPARIVMLTAAAVFGYVFNPLTVYWCLDENGSPRVVVAEVHNTYGQRHRYLLPATGLSATPKEFYVSPFFPVDGWYRIHTPLPDQSATVSISLWRPDDDGAGEHLAFAGVMRGHRRPGNTRELLRLFVRHPFSTLLVTAVIRMHGIWLWLRGVPVVRRDEAARGGVVRGH